MGGPGVLYRWAPGNWGSYTAWGDDALSRPIAQQHAYINGANNIWTGYTYNPASQLTSRWSNSDAYAFNGFANVNRPYGVNGLNQYYLAGPAAFGYNANGNVIADSSSSFAYDVENRLVSASGARIAALSYDPLGRVCGR